MTKKTSRNLTEAHKAVIKDKIATLIPLKSLAADPEVANLEIVADAAMEFVDVYNMEHLECVASLQPSLKASSIANCGKGIRSITSGCISAYRLLPPLT